VGADVLEDTLVRTLGSEVVAVSLGGRSLGDTLGNEVIGISLGYFEGETLGFSVGRKLREVLGSDDSPWLGDLLEEMLEDTLGRTLPNGVVGI
jgi:hypothetical protein